MHINADQSNCTQSISVGWTERLVGKRKPSFVRPVETSFNIFLVLPSPRVPPHPCPDLGPLLCNCPHTSSLLSPVWLPTHSLLLIIQKSKPFPKSCLPPPSTHVRILSRTYPLATSPHASGCDPSAGARHPAEASTRALCARASAVRGAGLPRELDDPPHTHTHLHPPLGLL